MVLALLRHARISHSERVLAGYRKVPDESGKPPVAAEGVGTRHPVAGAARQPAVPVREPVEKQRRAFFL